MITPHNPNVSAPSPDDDPTGVHDLLSSLPPPDQMPGYLVERINASLAAEQAQRAAISTASVTPLLASTRRRRGRLLFAITGAAAAVALVGVVGDSVFRTNQPTTISGSAAAPLTSSARASGGAAPQSLQDKASGVAAPAATPPLVEIRLSETRYTQADFVTQARALLALDQFRPLAADPPGYATAGPLGTTPGITDCLSTIGAGAAQMVRADLAFYDGRPALIIVATIHGRPSAYAVARQCSHTGTTVFRPATLLP